MGETLGKWTDELQGKYLILWCCLQPKDYGYIDNLGKYYGKVKGYAKTAEAERKMTMSQRIKLLVNSIGYQEEDDEILTDSVGINYNLFKLKYNTITTVKML